MKFNKILSSALVLVMTFSTLFVLFPTKADAAYVSESQNELSAPADIEAYVTEVYSTYDFETAEEMLMHELSLGYLTSVVSPDGRYAIYVNAYTGVLYYQDRITGQILTSNPWSYGHADDVNQQLLSQIVINFAVIATGTESAFYSATEAALRSQISTEFINGGIRVNYTFGDTEARYLLPGAMEASKYEEMILIPMLESLCGLMEDYCADEGYDGAYDIFTYEKYQEKLHNKEGFLSVGGLRPYLNDMKSVYSKKLKKNTTEYNEISQLITDINTMMVYYSYSSSKYEIPAYVLKNIESNDVKSTASILFRKYCGSYNLAEMLEDEKACGYDDNTAQKPVFNCAVEYGFSDDGSLSVRMPANSISFDETVYNLNSITVLQYFGAGDIGNDGYIFYPDGSGAVLEFEDYPDLRTYVSGNVYGTDYCYSKISGQHREQITMPVFGVVSDIKANESTKLAYGTDKVTNGYFAVIEEGASLATLQMETGGLTCRYGSAYCSYTPYPADEYDLTETMGVSSGASKYTIVAETKYNGSYVTRYAMLTDPEIAKTVGTNYVSSYVGMATYYRDLLYKNGDLSKIELLTDDLPLYIEVLGAMDVVKKILSFPITTSVPLTTFDNVREIYDELSNAVQVYNDKAAECEKLAAEAEDEFEAADYRELAKEYTEFAKEIENITNVNVRLTGFYNGGMYSTYPTKIKWSRACGGKKDFKSLISYASQVSGEEGKNLGIFADFDFAFISNTSATDGIRIKGNVSRMVDNRYASQQVYNSVLQDYESYYTLVVNPESFEKLYSKFIKKYSKYGYNNISVSTLGSSLNSNFDSDEPVNRDEAEEFVSAVLDTMSNSDNLNVMVDKGNIYSVKYASHIINAAIDSSHLTYSSYTVPFVGMVLHGSVSYTGSAINYSGTTAYDILRAIESGASLYYILCYQNEGYMKEDIILSDYYGVSYSYWSEDILKTYTELNSAIGDLQDSYIVDHKIIKGERVIEDKEWLVNYDLLMKEFLAELRVAINREVDAAYDELIASGAPYGTALRVDVDVDSILAWFSDEINLNVSEYHNVEVDAEADPNGAALVSLVNSFYAELDALVSEFEQEYNGGSADVVDVKIDGDVVVYDSEYSFVTDSVATDSDDDYEYTNYTNDIGNIVLVTYSDGTRFILNYNIYAVEITLEDGETYTLGKYEYVKIGGNN